MEYLSRNPESYPLNLLAVINVSEKPNKITEYFSNVLIIQDFKN
jgi:hypothetical protein